MWLRCPRAVWGKALIFLTVKEVARFTVLSRGTLDLRAFWHSLEVRGPVWTRRQLFEPGAVRRLSSLVSVPADWLLQFGNLTALELQSSAVDPSLHPAVSTLTNLLQLTLVYNHPRLEPEFWESLGACLANLPRLEYVRLSGVEASRDMSWLPSTLLGLDLDDCGLQDLIHVPPMLRLLALDLSKNAMLQDEDVRALVRAAPRLCSVNLNGCKWLSSEGFDSLQNLKPTLQHLEVADTLIEEASLLKLLPLPKLNVHGTRNLSASAVRRILHQVRSGSFGCHDKDTDLEFYKAVVHGDDYDSDSD